VGDGRRRGTSSEEEWLRLVRIANKEDLEALVDIIAPMLP
jgi:hypothetical protein